jgi:rhamnopyranosyl-N-acetylglucosaminyl-diphospho-decaprenol beta-1,3/1,4-galactofuranosyltransferase
MTSKVLAIIVTYKRPAVLLKCLQSIAMQNDASLDILVIVNSADAETQTTIDTFRESTSLKVLSITLNNEGPAGGFHEGLKFFLENESYGYAWLMDDDIVLQKNCLQHLLERKNEGMYLFPKVETASGKELVAFGWWGVLLQRELVLKAGLPLKDLFYWAEDTEYLLHRLVYSHHVQPVRSKEAVAFHLHQRGVRRPSWYYYYVPRNTVYYRTYIAGYNWFRFKRTMYLFPSLIYTIIFKEEKKLRKLSLLMLGTIHGFRKKIGKIIDPEIYT